jgi:hypothetical protein
MPLSSLGIGTTRKEYFSVLLKEAGVERQEAGGRYRWGFKPASNRRPPN